MTVETIRSKVVAGVIHAISVDTCIFTNEGYRLRSGKLKLLDQFKNSDFKLVFSEVTIREIAKHIRRDGEEAVTKLRSALRETGKFWELTREQQSEILENAIEGKDAKTRASTRMREFMRECGAILIGAKTYLDVNELLAKYFDVTAPFEGSKEKKSEFPDAITLICLEKWAQEQKTEVLFVTKDKGCTRYCEQSRVLHAVDDLSKALSLVQERDVHRAQLCRKIEQKIQGGGYQNLLQTIKGDIESDIWRIDWIPEADASFYYDAELEDVTLVNVTFADAQNYPVLTPVHFRDNVLIVSTNITAEIEAICNFGFSIKDGIDKDMVSMGNAEISRTIEVDLEILLSFEDPESETPELEEIELVSSRRQIDFGFVEPDYGYDGDEEY